RHRTPQRTALIKDAKPAHHTLASVVIRAGEIHPSVNYFTCRWFLQSNQMSQQRAFTATGAAHNDEDLMLRYGEVQIAHYDHIAEGQRQAAYFNLERTVFTDVLLAGFTHTLRRGQKPRMLKITANIPQATTIMTIA